MAATRHALPSMRIRRATTCTRRHAAALVRNHERPCARHVRPGAIGAPVSPRSWSATSHCGDGKSRGWARISACAGVVSLASGALLLSAIAGAFGGVPSGFELGRWLSQPSSQLAVSNLSATSVLVGPGSSYLSPGGTGDVWIQISNPNSFPVEITAVTLPRSSIDASGRQIRGHGGPHRGCGGNLQSGVTWRGARPNTTSVHILTAPIVIGASGSGDNPLTVKLADAARMDVTVPASCESTVFDMPSLAGLTTRRAAFPPTSSPTTSRWSP